MQSFLTMQAILPAEKRVNPTIALAFCRQSVLDSAAE
jgi:hypothetical protein